MTHTRWLFVAALLAVGLALVWSARPTAHTAAERVDRITAELRCPICQGLSVKDSSSETARAMKELVARRVAEGRTDEEIRAEFTRSYGDWVLLSPPVLSASGLVWLAPLAVVVLGALLALRRARAPAVAAGPALTAAERERLDALLAADEP